MYKDFKDNTWEKYNELMENGLPVWIFGAGAKGKEILWNVQRFSLKWNIKGIIDSNKEIHELNGYTVISTDEMDGMVSKNDIILISMDRPGMIAELLEKKGFSNYLSYFWLNEQHKNFCLQDDVDDGAISKVKKLLGDDKSRKIIDSIVEKRKIGFLDYTDIQEIGDEYFTHEFFSYIQDEVFIDGGGFDGDTVKEFVDFTRNKFKKIYTFEPDMKIAEKLKQSIAGYEDRVVFCPYGLSDKHEFLEFCNDNEVFSSHIVDNKLTDRQGSIPTSTIECCKLDDILENEKVTFIKMDIEGAELKALEGAENIIQKFKPKLAICIYHKPEDLWEIPLKIHEMVPEYKLYVRHFGARYYSTVLFASI